MTENTQEEEAHGTCPMCHQEVPASIELPHSAKLHKGKDGKVCRGIGMSVKRTDNLESRPSKVVPLRPITGPQTPFPMRAPTALAREQVEFVSPEKPPPFDIP